MPATGAPAELKDWLATPPNWLEILTPPETNYAQLQRLQPGEQAAIVLAQFLQADLLILDDLDARRTAQNLGLNIIGMLGVLGEAAKRNWISFPEVLNQLLQETNFRISPQLARDLLKQFS